MYCHPGWLIIAQSCTVSTGFIYKNRTLAKHVRLQTKYEIMKELLIMRHGKSDWSNPDLDDFDRPLKKRGRNDSLLMGNFIEEKQLLPDVVLCSTAVRAKETLAGLQKSRVGDARSLLYDSFYYEGTDAILEALSQLSDAIQRALIIGHNPTMESLLMKVFKIQQQEIKMPTAAIAFITNETDQWANMAWEKSTLEWIQRPKDLK